MVNLINDGYGVGGQWDEALAYFRRDWGEIFLPRLKDSFLSGPVNRDTKQ